MKALVGFTGFVGSNLYEKGSFDAVYNSENIKEAYGTKPDLLVYAGLRAEKYLANNDPGKDMEQILQAEENIRNIQPRELILISTIDVFREPKGVNEDTEIVTEGLQAYGSHRYHLECWAREKFPETLIVRLPGLFGKNLKKNFIYDYINVIPFRLKREKMDELVEKDTELTQYYQLLDHGFYQVKELEEQERKALKGKFQSLGFSALNFTDSRSVYQFYPLARLWEDIQIARRNRILLWHPATEPVSAGELYQYLSGEEFVNELSGCPAKYDYRTIWDRTFGGKNGYIMEKESLLRELKEFIQKEESRC